MQVALVNITDGTVQGHKAGCADLKRGKLRKHAEEAWTLDVESKAQAAAEYNADFDYEVDGWYEIEWAPCAKAVPEGDLEAAIAGGYSYAAPVEPAMTDEQAANAKANFLFMAQHAPTEQARTFWQSKADAL